VDDTVETKVSGLVAWMSEGLGCPVSSSHDPRTRVYFLRPESTPEIATLRVSLEALEDWDLPAILEDLERENLLVRLRREPAFWPMYSNARALEPLEELSISVDGNQHTITRDRDHNVRVFGPDGRLLREHPTGLLVNPQSLFRRPANRWEEDIRAWR